MSYGQIVWRAFAKATTYRGRDLWRDLPYEYAFGKLPVDVINGGPGLREGLDDAGAEPGELDALTIRDEKVCAEARRPYFLYRA